MNMRVGVLSDTHLRGVSKAFGDMCDQFLGDVDVILHAGDFVSAEVVELLCGRDFHGVHGNMDPIEVKTILPKKKVVELGPYRIGLIHGWGTSDGLEDRVWSEFQNTDVIVYGHSHRSANHIKNGVLFFNPGTATGFSYSGIQSVGILDLDDTVHGEIIPIE